MSGEDDYRPPALGENGWDGDFSRPPGDLHGPNGWFWLQKTCSECRQPYVADFTRCPACIAAGDVDDLRVLVAAGVVDRETAEELLGRAL